MSIAVLKRFARVGVCVVLLAGLCFGQRSSGRGRINGAGRAGPATPVDPNAPKGVYPTERGVLKSISGSQLFVEMDDEHEMKFRITRKTKIFSPSKDSQGKAVSKEIKASSLETGMTVDVDMQTSPDGSFEAVRISVVPNAEPPSAEPPK
jgi:hypothetical protein